MKVYFFDPATGLNADIDRHKAKIAEIKKYIEEAEAGGFDHAVRSYGYLLRECEESLVNVLAKKFEY